MSPNSTFPLLEQNGGKAVIALEEVRRDIFSRPTLHNLLRKLTLGDIALPVMRMEQSQKCAKGVHLQDLTDYLETRRRAAKKELSQMGGWKTQM